MTAGAPADARSDMASLPSWTPDERSLGDLELLLSGALAPLTGFMGLADIAALAERGTLFDGTPWPTPIALDVPAGAVPPEADRLILTDPEGAPIALLQITERTPLGAPATAGAAGGARAELVRLAGPVSPLGATEHGRFRQLRKTPSQVRAELPEGPVLAYATRGPLHGRQIGQLRHLAGQMKARLLLLPLIAGPAELVVTPESLVRSVLAARQLLPAGTLVVPVPLAPRYSPEAELRLGSLVARAYGATHLYADAPPGVSGRGGEITLPGMAIPVVSAGDWAYDPVAEVWRPLALIEPGAERTELSDEELAGLLDSGEPLPAWHTPEAVARELRRARPPRHERGVVVFMTGLSGSGKSTIARDLRDALAEQGSRTVSLLDGDQVRRLLSAGLTFSRADRDLNIARIGYVAAEIARHGGIAICAPIAPYAQARAQVRDMVSQTGDFLLVYVATPIDTCAARDRKGLYAKARAGLIDGLTGVSDPYEEPADADLVIDTSAVSRQEAVGAVLDLLTNGGWLEPRRDS
ncbi:MAG TPA: adenylyl-sulfate kinase [Streptosporangiaceae bacterium]|nr:adenylyl-sulfate kinase [Streptosporangiaceae bacterium]